jgi:hypothetical protein
VLNLSKLDAFHGFATDFITGIAHYKALVDSPRAEEGALDEYWQRKLTSFQRLCVLRCLRPGACVRTPPRMPDSDVNVGLARGDRK